MRPHQHPFTVTTSGPHHAFTVYSPTLIPAVTGGALIQASCYEWRARGNVSLAWLPRSAPGRAPRAQAVSRKDKALPPARIHCITVNVLISNCHKQPKATHDSCFRFSFDGEDHYSAYTFLPGPISFGEDRQIIDQQALHLFPTSWTYGCQA